jgi:hypothetical protein
MVKAVTICASVPKPMAGQHVGTVQLAGDGAIKQYLPVGLSFQSDVQAFVLEEAFFLGDGQRHHIRQLDKAELQLFLFREANLGCRQVHDRCADQA